MRRLMSPDAADHHAFTATELDAAEAQMPPGWRLDRAACVCAPAPGGRGWEAILSLVGPGARTMKCSSALHASAGDAHGDALASVADAVRMIQSLEGGRQTRLVVDPAEQPTLRPSQVLSLRGIQGERR